MPVRLTCPSCSTPLAVKDDHAGRSVRCPRCQAVIPPAGAAPTPNRPPVVVNRPPAGPAHPPAAARPNRPPVVIVRPGRPAAPPPLPAPEVAADPPTPVETPAAVPSPPPVPEPEVALTFPPLPPEPPAETPPPLPPSEPEMHAPAPAAPDVPAEPAAPPEPVAAEPPPLPALSVPETRLPEETTFELPPPARPAARSAPPAEPEEGIDLGLVDDEPPAHPAAVSSGKPAPLPLPDDDEDDRPPARRRPPDRDGGDRGGRRPRGRGADDRDGGPPRGRMSRPAGHRAKASRLPVVAGLVAAVLLCGGAAGAVFWLAAKSRNRLEAEPPAGPGPLPADRPPADPEPTPAGPVPATAEELGAAYEGDRAAADARYQGRDLLLTGTVTRYDPPPGDFRLQLVTVTPPGKAAPIPVYAHFDPGADAAARRLSPGRKVTLRGRCEGFDGISIDLRGCEVTGSEPAPADEVYTPDSLFRAFRADAGGGPARVLGKVVEVEARVRASATGGDTMLLILTAVRDDGSGLGYTMHASVPAGPEPGTPRVADGQTVRVRGVCDRSGTGVVTLNPVVLVGPAGEYELRLAAGEVGRWFADDTRAGERLYSGRAVHLTGGAFVAREADGTVVLDGNPTGPPGRVQFRLAPDPARAAEFAGYKPGDRVDVRGRFGAAAGGFVTIDVAVPAGSPPAGGGAGTVLSAADLKAAYLGGGWVEADAKYKGKVLVVSGTVAAVDERKPKYVVQLQPPDTPRGLDGVEATFDAPPGVAVGQAVTVRGSCRGRNGGAVSLVDCSVEPAAPAPPPADRPTAGVLLAEYTRDPAAADAKYKGKTLTVALGVVESKDEDGGTLVVVGTTKKAPAVKLRVTIDPAQKAAVLARVQPGNRVQVRGECAGLDGDKKFVRVDKAAVLVGPPAKPKTP